MRHATTVPTGQQLDKQQHLRHEGDSLSDLFTANLTNISFKKLTIVAVFFALAAADYGPKAHPKQGYTAPSANESPKGVASV